LSESGIYHVMLRGVNRDAIFLEEGDRERFLQALGEVKEASGCRVLAYCLVRNHVHLVLRTGDEPIGAIVKRLGVRYAGWFNRKYGRVGHLFQDRFRSLPVDDDAYLVTLLRYVWANPVEAGLVAVPEDYRWSSRRFFGRHSTLVDDEDLRMLLPEDPLESLDPTAVRPLEEARMKSGPKPRYSDAQVQELLLLACGARRPEDFERLDPVVQWRAVCELRTRSVPYEQIATVTGSSRSSIRRLHVAGSSSTTPGSA
jgi:REP element-mobilizing transposase RayT